MAKFFSGKNNTKLRRSREEVSSLEELTENEANITTNVATYVRNGNGRSPRRNDESNSIIEALDEEDRRSKRPDDSEAGSSRRASERFRDRAATVTTTDRIEELSRNDRIEGTESLLEVKPPRHRRKQWDSVNVAEKMEDHPGKPPRKRWSKDVGAIRLPETNNMPIPTATTDDTCEPAPTRSTSGGVQRNTFFYDNPAFASENEEIIRIETDHGRERTKIEIRRMSDRSSTDKNAEEDEAYSGSGGHLSRRSSRETRSDDAAGSSAARSSGSGKRNFVELDSSPSSGRITDASSEMSRRNDKSSRAMRDQSSLGRERRDSRSDSPATDAKAAVEEGARIGKKRKKPEKERRNAKRETRYVSVTVHRADALESNYTNAKQPMVKVHIVRARTGDYLRSALNSGEKESGFLQPMITGKFDFKENRSTIPVWEEELVFKHDFKFIAKREEDDRVVILFEVINLLNFAEASSCYDKVGKYLMLRRQDSCNVYARRLPFASLAKDNLRVVKKRTLVTPQSCVFLMFYF